MANSSHSLDTEALRYADQLKWRVFPLAAGSKIPPSGSRGFLDAATDPDGVSSAFLGVLCANIGIATGSGLLVVDIDPRHGGFESIASLKASGQSFGQCPVAKTGNGGRHLYFAISGPIKSRIGFRPGIDIKAEGGYVVAPPSRIGASKSGPGGAYQWLIDPFRTPLQWAPNWLLTELRPKPVAKREVVFPSMSSPFSAVRRLDGLARFVAGAPDGNRNHALNWASFRAAELVCQNQMSAREVTTALRAAAIRAGLDDPVEVSATIESGLRAGIEKGAVHG